MLRSHVVSMPSDARTSLGSGPSTGAVRRPLRGWAGALVVTLLGLGAHTSAVSAQSPLTLPTLTDPIVPGGYLRLDFVPRFSTWDSRYEPGGSVQQLGTDLTSANAASLFPGVATLEQSLQALTGSSTPFSGILGPVDGRVSKQITRLEFGGRVGVFDWLTLGVMVPWVRMQAPVDVAFRPDTVNGNLGLNPAAGGNASVSAFVTDLSNAYSAAQAQATSLCDADPTSAQCGDAVALAQRVGTFADETASAYGASSFFPLDGSTAATDLTAALDALNQDLVGAGLTAVPSTFTFPTERVDASTFSQISANPAGSIRGTALEPVEGLWGVGDIELSATVRLLSGEVRDSGATEPKVAWEVAGGALVRLGTGSPPDPDIFFDVGRGDGQNDLEGRVYVALRLGSHLEVRSAARYGDQRSTTLVRRVAPPTQILAPYSSRALVRWSPTSYFAVQVSPRLHLTDQLALSFDYDYYTKGEDSYALADPTAADAQALDPSLLAVGSGMTVHQEGFGLTYSTLRTWRQGRTGRPAEANIRLVRTVSGTGGTVPKATRFEMGVRVFQRLWGGS